MELKLELNKRSLEVLNYHGITEKLIHLFIKPILGIESSTEKNCLHYLAECFEVSEQWLVGTSEEVIELSKQNENAIQSIKLLLEYLIHSKQRGWKPKIILVKKVTAANDQSKECNEFNESIESNRSIEPPTVLCFIELSKITQTGIGYTAYKPVWDVDWKGLLFVCQAAGLSYNGIQLEQGFFEDLQKRKVMPIEMLKNAKSLWFPETTNNQELINTEEKIIKTLIEHLKIIATTPTQKISNLITQSV